MIADASALVAKPPKPTLRGVSHQAAFFAAIVATAALALRAPTAGAAAASAVYGASLTALFGVSALYHRPHWSPEKRQIMRRLDHSAIFLLIAGTYTPLFALLDDPGLHHRPLWIMWIGAVIGVGKSMLWPHAPKWITAALCVLFGWAAVGDVIRLAPVMGPLSTWLLVVGGLIYSVGALVYARRRPDPIPRVFGYHEVFHALVILASVCHFISVAHIVSLAR